MVPFRYDVRLVASATVMSEQQLPKPVALNTPAPAEQVAEPTVPGPSAITLPPTNSAPPHPAPLPPVIPDHPSLKSSEGSADRSQERIPHWLQQAEFYLRVVVRLYLGILVFAAPWWAPAWDANPLFSQPAWLQQFITQGAVRGVVSGLGLLNLWIALREAAKSPKP